MYSRLLTSRSARVTQRVTTHLYLGWLLFLFVEHRGSSFPLCLPPPFPLYLLPFYPLSVNTYTHTYTPLIHTYIPQSGGGGRAVRIPLELLARLAAPVFLFPARFSRFSRPKNSKHQELDVWEDKGLDPDSCVFAAAESSPRSFSPTQALTAAESQVRPHREL